MDSFEVNGTVGLLMKDPSNKETPHTLCHPFGVLIMICWTKKHFTDYAISLYCYIQLFCQETTSECQNASYKGL